MGLDELGTDDIISIGGIGGIFSIIWQWFEGTFIPLSNGANPLGTNTTNLAKSSPIIAMRIFNRNPYGDLSPQGSPSPEAPSRPEVPSSREVPVNPSAPSSPVNPPIPEAPLNQNVTRLDLTPDRLIRFGNPMYTLSSNILGEK